METTQEHENKNVNLAKEVAEIFGVSVAASMLELTALKVGAIGLTDVYLFSVVIGLYLLTSVFIWVKKW